MMNVCAGMYVMVVGGYVIRPGELPMIKVITAGLFFLLLN